jgi:histone H3/H4
VYAEVRAAVKTFIEEVTMHAVTLAEHQERLGGSSRKVVTTEVMLRALRAVGKTLYFVT